METGLIIETFGAAPSTAIVRFIGLFILPKTSEKLNWRLHCEPSAAVKPVLASHNWLRFTFAGFDGPVMFPSTLMLHMDVPDVVPVVPVALVMLKMSPLLPKTVTFLVTLLTLFDVVSVMLKVALVERSKVTLPSESLPLIVMFVVTKPVGGLSST